MREETVNEGLIKGGLVKMMHLSICNKPNSWDEIEDKFFLLINLQEMLSSNTIIETTDAGRNKDATDKGKICRYSVSHSI